MLSWFYYPVKTASRWQQWTNTIMWRTRMVVRSGSVVTACVWVGNVFVLTSDLWNYICLSETPPTPRLAVSRFRRWLFPAVTAVILLTVIIILGASSKYACLFLLMSYVGTTAFGSLVRPNFCELHKQSCIMWFVALMPNDRKHGPLKRTSACWCK